MCKRTKEQKRDDITKSIIRNRYKNKKLSEEQIAFIETIPGWSWETHKRKSIEDRVLQAENLLKEHKRFPSVFWLQDNGYSGLYMIMKRYPERFTHIPVSKLRNTLQEHINQAELLCKKYGKLPTFTKLKKNGYANLYATIKNNMAMFSHIPMERSTKTVDDQVVIAENLSVETGNLPEVGWLLKNGYNSLYLAMRSRPEKFSHILRSPSQTKLARVRQSKAKPK